MFFLRNRHSSAVAKNRLKLLLVSERIDCTPQMMLMLKNDMKQAVGKYFSVEENDIEIQFTKDPAVLSAKIPIHMSQE